MYFTFLETRIIDLHFPADSLCLHSNFSGGRRNFHKTFLFLKERRFGHSRASKVDKFGANRKRICDFLLVCNCNIGPILHRFRDIACFCAHDPPLFNPNFGGVPVAPDRRCWASMSEWILSYWAVK